MNRRNFLLKFFLWVLSFVLGYKIGEADSTIIIDKDGSVVSEKIGILNKQLADTAKDVDERGVSITKKGAVGDGVTNDKPAIDKAQTTPGASGIHLPGGQFLYNGQFIQTEPIIGSSSRDSVILINTDEQSAFIFAGGKQQRNSRLDKIQVKKVGKLSLSQVGIDADQTSPHFYEIEDVEVIDFPTGLKLGASWNGAIRDLTIRNAANYGVLAVKNANGEPNDIHFDGLRVYHTDVGVRVQGPAFALSVKTGDIEHCNKAFELVNVKNFAIRDMYTESEDIAIDAIDSDLIIDGLKYDGKIILDHSNATATGLFPFKEYTISLKNGSKMYIDKPDVYRRFELIDDSSRVYSLGGNNENILSKVKSELLTVETYYGDDWYIKRPASAESAIKGKNHLFRAERTGGQYGAKSLIYVDLSDLPLIESGDEVYVIMRARGVGALNYWENAALTGGFQPINLHPTNFRYFLTKLKYKVADGHFGIMLGHASNRSVALGDYIEIDFIKAAIGGIPDVDNHFYSQPAYLTGPPTAGSWRIRETVRNSLPAVGSYAEFVCIAAGTPGTWVGSGKIEALAEEE